MKTKHTPGPWSITERKQEIRGNAWRLVLEIDGPYTEPVTNLYGAESRANARLIAAAPEMLEALEEIMQQSYNGMLPEVFNDAAKLKKLLNLCGNIASRAIAKATGDL